MRVTQDHFIQRRFIFFTPTWNIQILKTCFSKEVSGIYISGISPDPVYLQQYSQKVTVLEVEHAPAKKHSRQVLLEPLQ